MNINNDYLSGYRLAEGREAARAHGPIVHQVYGVYWSSLGSPAVHFVCHHRVLQEEIETTLDPVDCMACIAAKTHES